MFVYSIRASSVKFFAFIFLMLALVVGVLVASQDGVVFASSTNLEIDYGGIKDAASRVAFIEQFGIDVDDEPIEEKSFKMPKSFDRVILGYNELQKKQGLDLSKYERKKVTRYTYKVNNYDYDGDVFANIFVYRNKIVAADISSADPEGFVIPLTLVDRSKLK
ncbi:MAG: DUF4830 domain-containing protein [Clostridia bacterium]|nr:DUF4830 domain-containing protein [Clostridia bacterium]